MTRWSIPRAKRKIPAGGGSGGDSATPRSRCLGRLLVDRLRRFRGTHELDELRPDPERVLAARALRKAEDRVPVEGVVHVGVAAQTLAIGGNRECEASRFRRFGERRQTIGVGDWPLDQLRLLGAGEL